MGKRKLRRQRDEARASEAEFAAEIKALRLEVQILPFDTAASAVRRALNAGLKRAEHAERDAVTERERYETVIGTNEKLHEVLVAIAEIVALDPTTVCADELPRLVAAHVTAIEAQRDALDAALAERATELRAERMHIDDLNGKLAIAMTKPPESLALSNMTKDRDYWMGECAHLGKQVAALAGEIKAMVEAGAHG